MASEASVADFTGQPPTVVRVDAVRQEEVHSAAAFPRTDSSPITFGIPQRNDEYVFLK